MSGRLSRSHAFVVDVVRGEPERQPQLAGHSVNLGQPAEQRIEQRLDGKEQAIAISVGKA